MKPPPYVDPRVVGAPIDFEWRGNSYHKGSSSLSGPIGDLVGDKTTCGTIVLLAGVAQWAAWRFTGHVDATKLLSLSTAAIAYQVDWRYVKKDDPPLEIPEQPPVESAFLLLTSYLRRSLDPKLYWDDQYQPIAETYHAAHVTNHVLPKDAKKAFSTWLKATAQRLDQVGARKPPDGGRKRKDFESKEAYKTWAVTHRGMPLPPQVLDPGFAYDPKDREPLIRAFLTTLDWRSNAYLRSPEDMLKLGFEGLPYQFP